MSIAYVFSRILADSRLFVVKFWGSQKLSMDFQLQRSVLPSPALFESTVYCLEVFVNHFYHPAVSLIN